MNDYLLNTIEKFKTRFYNDNRVIAMYLYGSGGKGTDDEYSDVDLGLIINDDFYSKVRDELKDICENICGKIHLWFPEGENKETCNYAFLFEINDNQFLYDFTIMTEHFFLQNIWLNKQQKKIIFDKAFILNNDNEISDLNLNTDNIMRSIEQYWIYTYLNGKYYKRQDIFKLLYIQNFLFNNHIKLLNALYTDEMWTWWPSDIKKLPKVKQKKMLIYFGSKTINKITKAIGKETEMYAYDANRICKKLGIYYPHELEEYVKKHLFNMGIICKT